jgi:hypothetical protein
LRKSLISDSRQDRSSHWEREDVGEGGRWEAEGLEGEDRGREGEDRGQEGEGRGLEREGKGREREIRTPSLTVLPLY